MSDNAYPKWHKCLTTITLAAVLILSGAISTFAQEAKKSEEAIKKSKTHDNVDPEYSKPMGEPSKAWTTDALLIDVCQTIKILKRTILVEK